jgi:HEAT repeat protein
MAMALLGKSKKRRAFDALAERLKNQEDREQAVTLLIAAGKDNKEAEPAVLPRLNSSKEQDAAVLLAACRILKEIGTNQSKNALNALKKDGPMEVRAVAEEALRAIDARVNAGKKK